MTIPKEYRGCFTNLPASFFGPSIKGFDGIGLGMQAHLIYSCEHHWVAIELPQPLLRYGGVAPFAGATFAASSVMLTVYRTPLYSKAYVPGVGPSQRELTYSRLPPVWTRRTYVLALAVVVVVRWTKSRSTGPLSLLPCRVYFPVRVLELVLPWGMFAT